MICNQKDIDQFDHIKRLKIINAITGIKPANLIGTISKEGITNVAVFSSVVHLGSSPALFGIVTRQKKNNFGDTYNNIIENKFYTINHIHPEFIEKAHYTSGKFNEEKSEFDQCQLTEEFVPNFTAPFVKESKLKVGMMFKEAVNIALNGTVLIIGEVVHLTIPDDALENNELNLETSGGVGISGLNSYYSVKKIGEFPHVNKSNMNKFNQ